MSARKTVFLHIGLPKTGTGFLQHTLHENHDAMAAAGLWCVRAGGHPSFTDPGNHLLPIRLIQHRRPDFQCAASAAEIRSAWRLAVEEIEACPCRSAFLSSELFVLDVCAHREIVAIRRYLRAHEVRIVVVLRDPVDFAHSLYMQRLRDGYSGTMSDYLELLGPHLDWRKLIDSWSAVFGDNCVIPLVYDDHTRRNLLAYFMASLFPRMIAPAGAFPHADRHEFDTGFTGRARKGTQPARPAGPRGGVEGADRFRGRPRPARRPREHPERGHGAPASRKLPLAAADRAMTGGVYFAASTFFSSAAARKYSMKFFGQLSTARCRPGVAVFTSPFMI